MESSNSSAPLVLLVDSRKETRDLRSDHLRRAIGVRTVTAASGEDALCIAEVWRPEVVLLDLLNLTLPFDGWEVARRIRLSAGLAEVGLVAVGHYTSVDDRRKASALGCDRLLVKPSLLKLEEAVRECLGKRSLSR
jgi:two-component system OmpR family response regulator